MVARNDPRLMILGLDGATWTVLDPLRRLGLMPNLDSLLLRAAHGTLRSVVPPVTTAAWTSLMTGCGPARHGIFDHRYLDTPSGQMKVNHSARVRVPTFWHLLSDAGRSVVSLNVPATYPPLDVRGVVVSGMDAPHLDAALSGSPEFARRLRAEVPGYTLRYYWKRAPQSLSELQENARLTCDLFRARAQGGLLADKVVTDWSVLMVQFQNLDPFQHRAWNYLNIDETGVDRPDWNIAARSVLRGLDEAIGLLLELAEQRGAYVMVVSDHGFGPCLGRIHVNRVLIDAGVARLPGLVGKVRRRVRQARDHYRLWGAKRQEPEARSSSFDLSVVAQFPFDWKRTLAFAPHQDTAAMVYLNTKERQSAAPLQTPRQIDSARGAVTEALASALHPKTGLPLFPRIIDTAEVYGIDPAREGYPELIALPDENYWVRTKLSPGQTWVDPDPNLPGTHRPEGIVALAGEGIEPGRTLNADLRDIAPTVLKMFGLPLPAYMEGHPLVPLHGRPLSSVREDGPSSPIAGPHRAQAQFDYTPEEQAIIEQRLADLGYLE
ncbi:MAG: alkaline phosphatase family protein [Isosphaeraceae bacterium]